MSKRRYDAKLNTITQNRRKLINRKPNKQRRHLVMYSTDSEKNDGESDLNPYLVSVYGISVLFNNLILTRVVSIPTG